MLIYKATNNLNGKIYIGLTTRDSLQERIKEHKRDSIIKDTPFYYAIRKYGFENFSWEIIEDNISSQEELDEREKYWIAFYDCYNNPEVGYNAQSGGRSFKLSDKDRLSRSERVKGEKNYFYYNPWWKGKRFSKTHKEHLSKSLRGKPKETIRLGDNPSAKKVINLSTGEIFDCIKSAAEKYGVTSGTIVNNINGKTKLCMNCKWDFYQENKEYPIEKRSPKVKTSYYVKELDQTFSTATALAKAINCDNSLIGKRLKSIELNRYIDIKDFQVKKVERSK